MLQLKVINSLLFKAFLICVFFIYYQTKFLPGSLHSWIMLLGIVFMLPATYEKSANGQIKVSQDFFWVLLLAVIIIFGYVINIATATFSNFQAYIMMLITYVYVKHNSDEQTLVFINRLVRWFLLINGILIILQTLTGSYFPARYLASGNPPLEIASGVSDGATKNGFLVAFSLSMMLASLFFKQLKFSFFDFLIFIIGLISLVLSASRAGMLSFGAVVLFGSLFSIIQSLRDKRYRLSQFFILFFIIIAFGGFFIISYLNLNFEMLYEIRDSETGNYGLNVMIYKASNLVDGSIEERFYGFLFFKKLIVESPLHLFSVGYGAGSFETLNGLNIHNSWFELLITTGLFGFVIFIALLVSVTFKAFKQQDSIKYTPIFFALLSVMVFMFAHDVLRGRIFWLGLGIISGVTAISQKKKTAKLMQQGVN